MNADDAAMDDAQLFRKRSLSDASSTASKRATSEDPSSLPSKDDVSLGASHLHIMDGDPTFTPSLSPLQSLLSDTTINRTAPSSPSDVLPPAYDGPSTVASNAPRPEGSVQLEMIVEIKRRELEEGESWFLVSRRWYQRWQAACSGIAQFKGDDASLELDAVGPIDNTDITVEGGMLRRPVLDGVEVETLPTAAWVYLLSWYGLTGGVFQRKVVKTGGVNSERVEFYPPQFHLLLLVPSTTTASVSLPINLAFPPSITLSSGATLGELKDFAVDVFSLHSSRSVRFWRLPDDFDSSVLVTGPLEGPAYIAADDVQGGGELIEKDMLYSLDDALLTDPNTRLAVEQQTPLGNWIIDETELKTPSVAAPVEKFFKNGFFDSMSPPKVNVLAGRYKSAGASSVASTSKGTMITVPSNPKSGGFINALSSSFRRDKSATRGGQRGLTGLSNLGNTCFMNSALQCMSNTKELQEYFLSGVYKNELNPDNPLGMNGQVAEAFGALIERLWSSSGGSVAPREFKQALSKFAPSFSGYGQQDTQELLAFLLDGTHEDLNRIKKKPATNAPDWNGGSDAEMVELAKICWEQYRSRNDSVIVDLFQGQYRSTVVCPDCAKVSITFDPFMYITMNLPIEKKWSGIVYFVPLDTSKPTYSIELELPLKSPLKALKTAVGGFMDVDSKNLLVMEEFSHHPYKAWYDDEELSEVKTSNDRIVLFELPQPFAQPKPRNYGKQRKIPPPPVGDDAFIIIPVLTTINKKAVASKYNSHSRSCVGATIFVSLTRLEASSVEGIRRAVAAQFARKTKRATELMEIFDDVDGTPLDAPVLDPSLAPSSVPLPDTPPDDNSMDVDEKLLDDPAIYVPTVQVPAPFTAVTVAPAPPTTSQRYPFKMYVPERKLAHVPLDSSDYSGPTVLLSDRTLPPIVHLPPATTLPGTFDTTPEVDDDVPMVNEAADPAPETVPSPRPLVKSGDYIVAEWDPAGWEWCFGTEGGEVKSTWEAVTAFVDPAIKVTKERLRGKSRPTITIQDCLHEFIKEERLGEDDTWYCPDCKKHQQATKKVEIWKVPDVLVFAFKRFSSGRYSREKMDDLVDFPVDAFDMEPFVEGDKVERKLVVGTEGEPDSLIYDLYAVDNHYGGMGGGHYTAYAKNHENGKWYDFDDSRVSEMPDPEKVRTAAAYLLFYRRRTARPIGAKSRDLIDSAIQSRVASAAVSDSEESPATSFASRSSSPDGHRTSFTQEGMSNYFNRPTNDYDPTDFAGFQPSSYGQGPPPASPTDAEPGSPSSDIEWAASPPRMIHDEEPVEVVNLGDEDELEDMFADLPSVNEIEKLD